MAIDRVYVKAFLRPRRLPLILPAMVVAAAPGAVWGQQALDVPQVGAEQPAPLIGAMLLPLPLACLVLAALNSEMVSLESRAARNLRALEVTLVTTLLALSCLLLSAALALNGQGHLIPYAIRGTVFWASVGLVSVLLLGRQLSWVAPLAAFVVMSISTRNDIGDVRAWAIPGYAIDSAFSWLITGTLCATGMWLATAERAWLRRPPKRGTVRSLNRPAGSGDSGG